MTTIITRDQMRPGQIVQRVTTQTYRVRAARWAAGWFWRNATATARYSMSVRFA